MSERLMSEIPYAPHWGRSGLFSARAFATLVFFMLMFSSATLAVADDRPTLDLLEVLDTVQAENRDIRSAELERERARAGYESARAGVGPQVDLELEPYGISERRSEGFAGGGDQPPNGAAGGAPVPAPATTRTQSTGGTLRFSQSLPSAGRISTEGSVRARALREINGNDNGDTRWEVEPSVALQFSQPVFVDGRLVDVRVGGAVDREARAGLRNAEIARRDAENGSMLAVVELYFAIADIRASVDTLEQSRRILSRQVDETESDVAAGVASEQQLLRTRLQENRTREALLEIREQLRGFERSFERLVGGSINPAEFGFSRASELDTDVATRAENLLDAFPPDARRAWDLSDNTAVRRARIAVEQARDERITNAPDRAPEFSVSGNISRRYPDERDDETDISSAFSDLFDGDGGFDWAISLGFTIPVYDGGRRGSLARSERLAVELSELEHREAEAQARDELADALERIEILLERLEILRADRDFEADRLVDIESLAEIDDATELEVDEVRLDLCESENAIGEAVTDLFLTLLDAERIQGRKVSEVVIGILAER